MAMNEYLINGRTNTKHDFIQNVIKSVKKSPAFVKISSIKHIKAYVMAGFILLVGFMLFGLNTTSQAKILSSTGIEETEERLALVLSEIDGVGDVRVMISYEGGMKKVIAYDTTTSNDKTSASGKETEYTSENKSPVTVNVSGTSSPLVLQELKPEIVGVIVVAEGAGNIRVRLDLLSAVKTVLNISSDKVEVFTMNN